MHRAATQPTIKTYQMALAYLTVVNISERGGWYG